MVRCNIHPYELHDLYLNGCRPSLLTFLPKLSILCRWVQLAVSIQLMSWDSSDYHFEDLGTCILVSKGHQRYDEVGSSSKSKSGIVLNMF